jgi:pyruvate kinase
VEPRVVPDILDPEDMPKLAGDMALKIGLANPGDRVMIVAGVPMGSPGAANLLRLTHAPRR